MTDKPKRRAVEIRLGRDEAVNAVLDVTGYARPRVAEPGGIDVMECRVRVAAGPLHGEFACPIKLGEFDAVRTYLERINSGNGPPASFSMAGGLLTLSFAPSRRGPVLCAVLLKSIEASHARLEFMISLEPRDIGFAIGGLAQLPPEEWSA